MPLNVPLEEEAKKVVLKPGEVIVDQKTLATVLEGQAKIEKELEDQKLKNAGLEEMMRAGSSDDKPKDRKQFTPAFRTVGIKKMPMMGDHENQGYVVGYTNRGAYQKVDKSGVSAQVVDYIDVIYLGHEYLEKDGKKVLQAESVPLLSLLGAPEAVCKVLEVKDKDGKPYKIRYQPMIDPDVGLDREGEDRQYTGEQINVTSWDPKHGLVETGEKIEGWVASTPLTMVIQIPGWPNPVEIDSKFCNI